ncbi:C4b-binding protein alpha chain-like isoform X2 [Rana temporaria]|uniref:C4b-binding protein alpha chain-like isoform X2 n=1 Tax=Rana temporaria TaxID=8407 RepID=UPI001AAD7AA2|nr:C4b-binding protein alpha chain-like isoform X2 [Rana temporaria]
MFPQKNVVRDHWGFLLLCFSAFIAASYGECGLPERISYAEPKQGALDQNTFPPNATVSYDCRPGYIRVPGKKNSITCLEDDTWSTPEVFCKRKSCGNPGELLNGNIEVTDFLFGSTVTYTCNEGYLLSNKRNFSVCLADGIWSNVLPQCDAVICAPPQSPANGEFNPQKDEYEYLNSVTFSCQKPLEVAGNASISCTGTGEWSSNSPTCKAVNCPNPDVKNSRRLSGFTGPYTLNSAILFECNKGFVLRGSSSISCNIDSEWVPAIPQCDIVNCSNPDVKNSTRLSGLTGPYTLDSVISFECDKGFVLRGSSSISCNSDGQWVPAIPQCEIVNCSNPDVKNSTRLSGLTGPYTLDSVISFECDKGFVLRGSSSISCNSDGQWVPAIPQCETVECSSPDVANAARLSGFSGSYHFNFTVTFECFPGFTMNGSNSVKCNASSQWDPPLPTCNENNVAEVMGNGIVILTMIFMGHVLSHHF